jgi:hypothetical protein
MKRFLMAVVLIAATAGGWAGQTMKPGLWELRTTKQVVDGQDMTAQMAAAQAQMNQAMGNMPAAQRKQMEAMMGKQGMPASGNVQRICVSSEMAARDRPVLSHDGSCEPSKVSRSGDKMSFEFNCVIEGRNTSGRGESVVSGDTISSKMDMTTTDAKGKHTMQTESQMKYLGSDCQGLKPADQIAKDMQAKMPAQRGR